MTAPRESRLALWVGAAVVALVVGGFVFKLGRTKSSNVPSGIAGVRLGDTLDEARVVLPALVEAGSGVFRAETRLFDEPATCTLELAVSSTVSHVECVMEGADPRVQKKLLATLRELYGKETETREGSWLWRNERARLRLTTSPSPRLVSWSRAHEEAKAR